MPSCTGAGAAGAGHAVASAATTLHEPPSRAAVPNMTAHASGTTLPHAMHAGQTGRIAMCHSGHRMQQQPQQLPADKEVRSIFLEAGKPDGSLGSRSVLSQLLRGACASWQHASCSQLSHHCHPSCGGTLVMVRVGLVACLRTLHAQHVAQSALGTGRLSSPWKPSTPCRSVTA